MRYCALMGDIEWYEDELTDELYESMADICEKYENVTFLALPMCAINGRVIDAVGKINRRFKNSSFALCSHRYTDEYIAPGKPYDTIVIPANINKTEDYYPYMCKWAIDKCESVIIYVGSKTLSNLNSLSVNAMNLADYAKKQNKELILIKPR